jgi:membrane associated rhomboid family serine protease/Tfp pilus assembly protein PilF
MANCVQCGRELPPLTVGDLRDKCVECQVRERIERERQYKASQPTTWQMAQMFPVTAGLLAINVLVFLLCTLDAFKTGRAFTFNNLLLLRWGADYGPLTLDHQYWRILTSMFVHGNLLHIGTNMWCFWDFGRITERVYGRWRYLAIYLLTGLASSVASLAMHPSDVSVGASGAIFGVVGALVFPFYRKRLVLPAPVMKAMMRSLVSFIVINLLIGSAVTVIDNAAHVGGLLMGLILGAVITHFAITGADLGQIFPKVAAVAVIAVATGFVGVQHLYRDKLAAAQAYMALERGDLSVAIDRAKQAIAKNPKDIDAHAVLAEAYFRRKQFADAVREYQAAYALNPKDDELAGQLGAAYLATGQFSQAETPLRQALQADPNDAINNTNLGIALADLNRPDEALMFLRKALTTNPKSAKTQYALGSVLIDKHQYREALGPLGEAVKLDPQNPDYKKTLDDVSAQVDQK